MSALVERVLAADRALMDARGNYAAAVRDLAAEICQANLTRAAHGSGGAPYYEAKSVRYAIEHNELGVRVVPAFPAHEYGWHGVSTNGYEVLLVPNEDGDYLEPVRVFIVPPKEAP